MNSKQMGLSMIGVAALAGAMVIPSSATAQCDPLETQKLLASDGAAEDSFGMSVSMSGDSVIIGAFYDDDHGTDSGSAYVFEKTGNAWTQVIKLTATDGAAGDLFGICVCMSGDTALVGASVDDGYRGSAYVFEKIAGVWTQVRKLTASDGAAGDQFGDAISLNGETAVVGAAGRDSGGGVAYVFEKTGGVWRQAAKLLASDGAAWDQFGRGVSISGQTVLVGAPDDDDGALNTGSVYVFEKVGSDWTQVAKLRASDGTTTDEFGFSVSVSGDIAVIGARGDGDRGRASGSAYIFERVGGIWTQVAKLHASDGVAYDNFGQTVFMSGQRAAVGAYMHNYAEGSVYVYDKTGGAWPEVAKLTASDAYSGDQFGLSFALVGDTAIVGSRGDDARGESTGAAYVFDLQCGPQLSVNASCPSGGPIQVSWSGATGGGTVALLYARNTGSFRIPNGNPCAGTQLGLGSNQLQIGYQGAAGQNGSRTVNANAGPGVCGGYLQLLDVATCGTSNVVRIE